jgi:hypothetical protein
MTNKKLYPKYPFYIVSKGRYMYMTTSKALTKMGVAHHIVVEPSEVDLYQKAIEENNLLATIVELDLSFKTDYETCDDLGLTKSTGPGPARNFAWHHSKENGHPWHWVMDDNIAGFFRLNNNLKTPCLSYTYWTAMEDFMSRYENTVMGGPNYFFFAPRKTLQPAFVTNTRIYSCNLIRNDIPFRWRGRYNEDTILSLDILTSGLCTVQFNAFLQDKLETQKQTGGNTTEFYHAEGEKKEGQKYADGGTYLKSKMLVDVYPQFSEIVEKFNRVHHKVDYRSFKINKLKLKENQPVYEGVNNYGMELIHLNK